MGQYYMAVNLDTKEYMSPWDYDRGVKLMEHSWFRNNFVNTAEKLMSPDGPWYKTRLVWAGDYGDEGKLNFLPEGEEGTLYNYAERNFAVAKPEQVPDVENYQYRYLINHITSEYVDKEKVRDHNGWRVHPLPLLTCDNNGAGGSYYERTDNDKLYVCSWAGDIISADNEVPEGFTEIIPDFIEEM